MIVVGDLVSGIYTSTEEDIHGWTLSDITCDDNNSAGNVSNRTATFNLDPGETVKCVFINEEISSDLTICKFDDYEGDGEFNGNETLLNNWTMSLLNVSGVINSGVTGEGQNQVGCVTFTDLSSGEYEVTETQQNGWTDTTGLTQLITLGLDDDQIIYFGNQQLGTIVVHKDVRGQNGEDIVDITENFTVTLNDEQPEDFTDGGMVTYNGLIAGEYTIKESVIPRNYSLYGIVPDNDTGTEGAQITVNPGDTVDVYIENRQNLFCGDGIKNLEEECDGEDGVGGEEFCTSQCKLVPIYDGQHQCPENTTKVFSENITLSSEIANIESFSLNGGKSYLLEASGTYQYASNSQRKADTAYGTTNDFFSWRSDVGIWGTNRGVTSILGDLGRGMGVIEWDDDQNINSDHLYSKLVEPEDSTDVEFVISDWYSNWYGSSCDSQGCLGDNSGSLNVDLYECVETILPAEPECEDGNMYAKVNTQYDGTIWFGDATAPKNQWFELPAGSVSSTQTEGVVLTYDGTDLTVDLLKKDDNSYQVFVGTIELYGAETVGLTEGTGFYKLEDMDNCGTGCYMDDFSQISLTEVNVDFAITSAHDRGIISLEQVEVSCDGTVYFQKYECSNDELVPDNVNRPSENGFDQSVPGGCTLVDGYYFGYVNEDKNGDGQLNLQDVNYDYLANEVLGTTSSGKGVYSAELGDYIFGETEEDGTWIPHPNTYGMLCSTSPDGGNRTNNAEKVTMPEQGNIYCVAYNPVIPEINGSCEEDPILFMIGDKESNRMDNPVDEFGSWFGFGVFNKPPYPLTDPIVDGDFIVGVDDENDFPWNSNKQKNKATDFNVTFNYGGSEPQDVTLTMSWSPGRSAKEQKEVFLDGASLGKTPVRMGASMSGWWEKMELFEDEFTFKLTPGVHTLNFHHPIGDGTLWDYVKLAIDCEPLAMCEYDFSVNNDSNISTIDLSSGSQTQVGTLLFGSSAAAAEPNNGDVYYIERYGSDRQLAYYDIDERENVLIGNTGITAIIDKMAFDEKRVLYAMSTTSELFTVNITSGVATSLGIVSSIDQSGGDLVFDDRGDLYAHVKGGKLYHIELPSLSTTVINETGVQSTGMIFKEDGTFYATDNKKRLFSFEYTSPELQVGITDSINDLASCPVEVKTTDVNVCKMGENKNPLSNWDMQLLGEYVETIIVPTGTGVAVSSSDLPEDNYVLVASGTYEYRGNSGLLSDANFSQRLESDKNAHFKPGTTFPYWNWVDVMDFKSSLEGYLGIMVNGVPTSWSNNLATNNKYALGYTNYSGAFNFTVLDSYYGDNVGDLQVDIYKGYAGTTGEGGCVTFDDVPFGDYEVTETLQSGWENVDGLGGVTVSEEKDEFMVMNKELLGDLQICKFEDSNGDGTRDKGDEYIKWKVGVKGQETVQRGEDGCYTWSDLPVGEYTAFEVEQEGWMLTTGNNNSAVTVNDQETVIVEFGNYRLGSIQGRKYRDVNGNGDFDQDEKTNTNRLDGWTITLYNQDFSQELENIVTGDDNTPAGNVGKGQYRFENLPLGTYQVCEEAQGGWMQTEPASGAVNPQTRLYCHTVALTETGQKISGVQFGNFELSEISGKKWEDNNIDGTWTGEEGLDGWGVVLGEYSKVGEHLINSTSNTPVELGTAHDGVHYVLKVRGTYDAGDKIIADAECSSRDGGPWKTIVTNYESYGEQLLDLELNGAKTEWGTCNPNHVYSKLILGDGSDFSALINDIYRPNNTGSLEVEIYRLDNTQTTTTAGGGNYEFKDLLAGKYAVCEMQQDGYLQTHPQSDQSGGCHMLTITSGSKLTEKNFGNVELSDIRGYKWNDLNGNRERDCIGEGDEECQLEPLLSDWRIFIDENGDKKWDENEKYMDTSSEKGDHFGWYWFEDLLPGKYSVCEVLQERWQQTYPGSIETAQCHTVNLPDCSQPLDVESVTKVRSNDAVEIYCQRDFGNQPIESELFVSKTNDGWSSGPKKIGDKITYTMKVRAQENGVSGVTVTDLPPKNFSYVRGSWTANSNKRGDLKVLGVTTEPTYASPGDWQIGDMIVNEVVTLTYQAQIESNANNGLHKDLVWGSGKDLRNGDLIALTEDSGFSINGGVINDNFSGTQIAVESLDDPEKVTVRADKDEIIEEEEVTVKGATFPATGANALWLIMATIILMIGSFLMVFSRRKRIRNIFGLVLLTGLVVGIGQVSAATTLTVRIDEPDAKVDSAFNLGFVAMDVSGANVNVECFKKGPADSGFSKFQDTSLISGGSSGNCEVTTSVLDDVGNYSFKVIANGADSSDTVTTFYDGTNPGKPKYVEKDEKNSCRNEITFRTANDGQTAYVEVYRSHHTRNITVDENSKIKTITTGPNQKHSFNDNLSNTGCGDNYYYAVRAFDDHGNYSLVREEEFEVTTIEEVEVIEETTATEVTPAATEGETGTTEAGAEVAGEGTAGEGEESGEGEEAKVSDEGAQTEDATEVLGVQADSSAFSNVVKSWKFWLAVLILAAIGYRIYKNKKSPTNDLEKNESKDKSKGN